MRCTLCSFEDRFTIGYFIGTTLVWFTLNTNGLRFHWTLTLFRIIFAASYLVIVCIEEALTTSSSFWNILLLKSVTLMIYIQWREFCNIVTIAVLFPRFNWDCAENRYKFYHSFRPTDFKQYLQNIDLS